MRDRRAVERNWLGHFKTFLLQNLESVFIILTGVIGVLTITYLQ